MFCIPNQIIKTIFVMVLQLHEIVLTKLYKIHSERNHCCKWLISWLSVFAFKEPQIVGAIVRILFQLKRRKLWTFNLWSSKVSSWLAKNVSGAPHTSQKLYTPTPYIHTTGLFSIINKASLMKIHFSKYWRPDDDN